MVTLVLGTSTKAKGCLTRLIDVINRPPALLEDLIGFNRGRLGQGFYLLLLQQALAPGDFTFFGYTYMSGGKTGLPSNNPAVEDARPKVHDALMASLAPGATGDVQRKQADYFHRNFVDSIPLAGPNRYVKVVPLIDHNPNLGAAEQYPASPLGIAQLNLLLTKTFLVAAKVSGVTWELANNTRVDVGARPRYDFPYAEDPRKQALDYLSSARPT